MSDELDEAKNPLYDEDDEEDDDNEELVGKSLPWGIRKALVEAAPDECKANPRAGDEVSITFVARLQDGKEISASKDEKKPFKFALGQNHRSVVEGLELAVKTMRRGEIANFTIAPRFAYGELGSPPLVPPDATVVFEIKLLDWAQGKVDLFEDDRAVKTILDRGHGDERPVMGQEVLVSVVVVSRTGQELEAFMDADHVVGAADFGVSSKIVSQALLHMVEGERASVHCRRFTVKDALVDRTLQGAKIEIALLRVYETRDVSPARDGSVMKKVLRKRQAQPAEGGRMQLLAAVASREPRLLEFRLGDGEVCDELEAVVAEMKVGEEALVRCGRPQAWMQEPALGLADIAVPEDGKLRLTLTLQSSSESAASTGVDKLAMATARKEVAASLFKQRRYWLALKRYDWILALLSGKDYKEANRQMCSTCELNRAACLLPLEDYAGARIACDKVLESDAENVKALFRRASASFQLSDYSATQRDLAQLLRLDPKNGEARALHSKLREAQKRYAVDEKATAAKMWGQKPPETPSSALVEKELARSFPMRLLMPCMGCFPLRR